MGHYLKLFGLNKKTMSKDNTIDIERLKEIEAVKEEGRTPTYV